MIKSDVEKVLATIAHGSDSPSAELDLSYKEGQTEVQAASLDELLAEAAPRESLSNLHIDFWRRKEVCRVVVDLDDGAAHLRVSGNDLTWVYGKAGQLEEVLKGARSRRRAFFVRYELVIPNLVLLTLAAMWTAAFLLDASQALGVIGLIVVTSGALALSYWRFARGVMRRTIVISEAHDASNKIAIAGLVVALFSLAAAVAQVALAA
ncbi:hypothetical protein [Dactylosporangium sp. CA-139066]|uniref:hypothetical protein n=1 Tax=Dactylosporangium sp. CA-139066 TaxID=3239930 RepID=UPI003D91D735